MIQDFSPEFYRQQEMLSKQYTRQRHADIDRAARKWVGQNADAKVDEQQDPPDGGQIPTTNKGTT